MSDLAEAYFNVACFYKNQRELEKALDHLNIALEKGYSEYWVKLQQSLINLELGKLDEASRDAGQCLSIIPEGEDRGRLIDHIRYVNSKLDVPWVKRADTVLTGNRSVLPSFLIIGTQKGGTTSLYSYLTQHPNVKAAIIKEVHFFDEQYHFGLDWYKTHFPESLPEGEITGEASPYYLFHPQVPGRVKQTIPNAKFIVLLRNPIDRAYSHYQMMVRRGMESLPFGEAVRAEHSRLHEEYERMESDPGYNSAICSHFSYLKRGLYNEQLERWFRLFPREQFLILNSEELYERAAECYEKVTDFLGMPEWQLAEYKALHEGGYEKRIDPETFHWLKHYFAPHNRLLFDNIGESYDGWL